MPWIRIRDALASMSNLPTFGPYGGPITYRGISYSLDLSQLPSPPLSYRIGGGSIGLLDLIQRICQDGGVDFFITLEGFTIKVRTISRLSQPPLGTITAYTETNYGDNVVRSSAGIETRNETTSSFLVGGQKQEIYLSKTIVQFWGYDNAGNPIVGRDITLNFFNDNDVLLAQIDTEEMRLEANVIADIIGRTTYDCTILEMRLAQASQEAWRSYIVKHRADLARFTGLTSTIRS